VERQRFFFCLHTPQTTNKMGQKSSSLGGVSTPLEKTIANFRKFSEYVLDLKLRAEEFLPEGTDAMDAAQVSNLYEKAKAERPRNHAVIVYYNCLLQQREQAISIFKSCLNVSHKAYLKEFDSIMPELDKVVAYYEMELENAETYSAATEFMRILMGMYLQYSPNAAERKIRRAQSKVDWLKSPPTLSKGGRLRVDRTKAVQTLLAKMEGIIRTMRANAGRVLHVVHKRAFSPHYDVIRAFAEFEATKDVDYKVLYESRFETITVMLLKEVIEDHLAQMDVDKRAAPQEKLRLLLAQTGVLVASTQEKKFVEAMRELNRRLLLKICHEALASEPQELRLPALRKILSMDPKVFPSEGV
jgi:hypothetical protein